MGTQTAQNWIALSGLLLVAGNLFLFFQYLRATNRIKDASIEQSEGLSKPAVLVQARQRAPDDNLVSYGEIATDHIFIVNVGNGPALKLEWKYEANGERLATGLVPYLESRQVADTGLPVKSNEVYAIICRYAALSDVGYESVINVEGYRRIASIKISRLKEGKSTNG